VRALDAGVSVEVRENKPRSTWTSSSSTAPVTQLAQPIRRHVIDAVEQMTGLKVVEVNVHVKDLHRPDGASIRRTPRASSDPDFAVPAAETVEAITAAVCAVGPSPGCTAASSTPTRCICQNSGSSASPSPPTM
jgi:hypothetical protein